MNYQISWKFYTWDQAIDKDNSGYNTTAELGKMSQARSKKKCEASMKKLDTDGDGKITLLEFQALFADAEKWNVVIRTFKEN